ncbi:MAG: 3-oxoacyl-ACP synthase [Bacteroidota bacterium]
MSEQLIIGGYCIIRNNQIFFNKELLYQDESALTFSDFSKSAYRFKNAGYPKFFKMDNLSKLGFLTTEILLGKYNAGKSLIHEKTGIVIANSSSSLDTDFTYFDSIRDIADYFPSPSVFVYTLPNIMIGEICIRHKITGESAFFISERFDPEFIFNYVQQLFVLEKVQQCITGWVELMDDKYEALLFFVEKNHSMTDENVTFDSRNISEIYLK